METEICNNRFGTVTNRRVRFRHSRGIEDIDPRHITSVSLTRRTYPLLGIPFLVFGAICLVGIVVALLGDRDNIASLLFFGVPSAIFGVILTKGRDHMEIETASGTPKQRISQFWDYDEAKSFIDAVRGQVFFRDDQPVRNAP